MLFAAFYSESSLAVLVILVASWVLFWGTLSAAVLAIWRRPNLHSLWMGIAGPFGLLIALTLGLARSKNSGSVEDAAEFAPPSEPDPRMLPR